jgi:hypothetical protein
MPETLEKLRPDRDLQCYFERPSAIAALSATSSTGFTVSGSWRQQFDWAVIEWNRDNTFEHPLFRYLPDGDLSGLVLSYEETRENCIPMDSVLFPTVDWPSLRVWASDGGVETVYKVPLKDPTYNHAEAIEGSYAPASAVFELQGTATEDDFVELAWEGEHYTVQLGASDGLAEAAEAIVQAINGAPSLMIASRSGTQITLQYVGVGQTAASSTVGANGNRLGVYGNVYREGGTASESWSPAWQTMSGGQSPTKWAVTIDFSSLMGQTIDNPGTWVSVPTNAVRKLRWTYAADLQTDAFERGEFQVVVSNWTVTGTGRGYLVAGPESRRIEDDRVELVYSTNWSDWVRGNYSGGSIRYTTTADEFVTYTYTAPQDHRLYLGTRKAPNGAEVTIAVDALAESAESLVIAGEDVLTRILLAELAGGVPHTVTVTHSGDSGSVFYFDFFEIAVPVAELPEIEPDPQMTLATDWDTDHSIALAPERTAWMINSLGFTGRQNHYVGALWFYELYRKGHVYASATVEFIGTPVFSEITTLTIGLGGADTDIQHLNLRGDTASSVAKAFELLLNNGYTGVRATSTGAVLTVYARAMGSVGNAITLSVDPDSGSFHGEASGSTLSGGDDGEAGDVPQLAGWRTDLEASPRINRAARDWTRSFFTALAAYGLNATAAFSMELQHGDPALETGIAQRYPSGAPVLLNTPALQTNFSPISTAFWQDVYLDCAEVMADAELTPYLQFGEVQWWYFPYDPSGLPFYDDYTTSTFSTTYGRSMHVFVTSDEDPASYPEEAAFLPGLIGTFTDNVMDYVRQTYANAWFEVLYPPDVNDSTLNRVINLPAAWASGTLDNFKTENFTYTGNRDLNKALESVVLPIERGFARDHSSHLVGIGDYTTPWLKEVRLAKAEGVESVVLFALDQFCLIGFPAPLRKSDRRSGFTGWSGQA